MGVTNVTWASLQELFPTREKEMRAWKVVELGDQRFYFEKPFIYAGVEFTFLKNYFDFWGISHTSIDWNGSNGALKLDFTKEIPFAPYTERYDILTNFGFNEHVSDQYAAWKNVNDLIKVGGLIISELPAQANFPGHFEFPYYTLEFFQRLALKCGYEIEALRYQQHTVPLAGQVVWCVLKKTKSEFISKEDFAEVEAKLGKN